MDFSHIRSPNQRAIPAIDLKFGVID